MQRYVGRPISILTSYDQRLIGTVASVDDEFVRLIDVEWRDQLQAGGWFERIQHEDHDAAMGPKWPEAIVQRHAIHSITCLDDAIRDLPYVSEAEAAKQAREEQESPGPYERKLAEALEPDGVRLEIGIGCIRLFDPASNGDGMERLGGVRMALAEELGFVIPPVRVHDRLTLAEHAFQIAVHGRVRLLGKVDPARWFALRSDPRSEPLAGEEVLDPVFNVPGYWIDRSERERASLLGYAVVSPTTVIATSVAHVLRTTAAELLTYDDVRELVTRCRRHHPTTVDTLMPTLVGLPTLHEVLRRLLAEKVCIRNLAQILEATARHLPAKLDAAKLIERIRADLGI